MRELAINLNIKAASLYWHIKNKDELLGLIAEHICTKLSLNESLENARIELIHVFSSYRANLLEVRDSVEIFRHAVPTTPARVALIKTIFDKLESMGVPKEKLIQIVNLLNNYVLSFVDDELQFKQVLDSGVNTFYGYPYDSNFDQQFECGLVIILDGVESTCR